MMTTSTFEQQTPDPLRGPANGIKSKAEQRKELFQMKTRLGLTRDEYEMYRFQERSKDYSYMLNFMTVSMLRNKYQAVLNDPQWNIVLGNKWLFHLHFSQFSLPLPAVYGIYDRGSGFTCSGKPLATPSDLAVFLQEKCLPSLVAKPVGGAMGKQVLILDEMRYQGGTIEATTNTGQELTFAQIAELLDQPTNRGYYRTGGYRLELSGYLLQAKVQQHPFVSELSPMTTNTARVITFLDHMNNPHIHFAVLRVGRHGNVADNWDRGGLSVAVDIATGVLGQGVLKPKYGGQWLEVHPDSGVRFTGQQLPYWAETVALCKQAARVLPKVRSIGWDVAITPTGPVLIEGNTDWALAMMQMHTQGYLQPVVRAQLAPFGLTFPERTLPPVNPRDWFIRLRERYRRILFLRRQR